MNTPDPTELDLLVTAYSLNEPTLTPEQVAQVQAHLAADSHAAMAERETRELSALLTSGLAAERASLPPTQLKTSPRRRRSWTTVALAASVLLATFAGAGTYYFGVTTTTEHASVTLDSRSQRESVTGVDDLSAIAEVVDERNHPEPGRARASRQHAEFFGKSLATSGSPAEGLGGVAPAPGAPGSSPSNGFGGGGFNGGGPPAPSGYIAPNMPTPSPAPATGPMPVNKSGPEARFAFKPGVTWGDAKPGDAVKGDSDKFGELPEAKRKEAESNDRHLALVENPFTVVQGQAALSTFGVDVDTASYSIVRRFLSVGQMPPANAVRLEELVNYFPYQDPAPAGDDPYAVKVELAECPWQPAHRLARIGVKAKPIDLDKRPPSNLVFLIDVSGSMGGPDRLPLVVASLKLLVNRLGENDRIALVVYAGSSGLVLDSTSASRKPQIVEALDRLQSGGSTNGGSGVTLAYNVAAANFIKGGTNRVILCSDGDWNVGTTGTADLIKLIEEKRQTGVFLSVLGFGMGNLRDEMMVQLAGKGNGNYAYIDSIREANKALVEQLGGTLVTVAKDVKIQVEFNPAVVQSYRLLGYEKRHLNAEDFANDKKDAGEMGAGHVVTALYELVPVGPVVAAGPKADGLKYQPLAANAAPKEVAKASDTREAFTVKMRHKKPDGDTSILRELPVMNESLPYSKASEDFRFAASVASFAMLLRNSEFKGNSTYAAVIELADAARTNDPGAYRQEFLTLARKAKELSGQP